MPLAFGRRGHRPDRRLHDGRDVDGPQIELQLAGDDPRHVEQLVDDLVLRGGVPDDGVHGARGLVGRELAAVEQVGPARRWRSSGVRSSWESVARNSSFRPFAASASRARLLRLPVEVRVVHGDGRVGREAGDQPLVTLVEEPGIGMSEEEARRGARRRRERTGAER